MLLHIFYAVVISFVILSAILFFVYYRIRKSDKAIKVESTAEGTLLGFRELDISGRYEGTSSRPKIERENSKGSLPVFSVWINGKEVLMEYECENLKLTEEDVGKKFPLNIQSNDTVVIADRDSRQSVMRHREKVSRSLLISAVIRVWVSIIAIAL
jgi:hypothetical protein